LIVLSGDERGIPLALGAAICLADEREVVRFTYLLRESDISIDDPLSSIKAVIGLPNLMARYENDFQSIQFN
jgi:hypothetical protein